MKRLKATYLRSLPSFPPSSPVHVARTTDTPVSSRVRVATAADLVEAQRIVYRLWLVEGGTVIDEHDNA